MSEKEKLLEQLSSIIEIYEKAYYTLRNDKFHDRKSMIEYYSQIYQLNEELKEKNYNILLMQLANENYKEPIFKDLIQKINDYNDLVFEKKACLLRNYLDNCFNQIPRLIENKRKIDICKKDINDMKYNNSSMPEHERQQILKEFEDQLCSIYKEREKIEEEFSWVKENHYLNILWEGDKIIEKIENYFNISIYKFKKAIFDFEQISKLFDTLVIKGVLTAKSKLTSEDFYLILNLKEPKENQKNSLKVSHFAYPLKLLSYEVSRKGFDDKEWKKYIVKQFGFKEETLKSKSSNTFDKQKYQEIICSKTVKNGV